MVRRLTWIATALLLTGCPASMPSGTSPMMPTPGATGYPGAKGGSLGNLVGDALNREENELRAIQKRPQEINFPVRLGVLFYGYQTALKPEDQKILMDSIFKEMVASGLVKSTFEIPNAMLQGGENLDSIRKLSARFQVDALLIVSGSQSLQRADNQPLGFFDSFTNRAYYEARTSLTAIAMNIYTGTFFEPFSTVGKDGPVSLDADAADYATNLYAMRTRAETQAFTQLKSEFLASMERLKAVAVPPGSLASPEPSPTATPTPSPSPSTP